MTTFLSRRAALLAAGAGAITMLSACSSDIRPLTIAPRLLLERLPLQQVLAPLLAPPLLLAHPLRMVLLRSLIWGR